MHHFYNNNKQLREMAIIMYFKKQSLPMSSEAELPDTVTREVNNAVENILEEKRNRTSKRKL